jgi:actin-like ATPase involved in cell morphogenesis
MAQTLEAVVRPGSTVDAMPSATDDRDRHRILKVWLRFEHGLAVSVSDAGSALAEAEQAPPAHELDVSGRDLVTGMPRTVVVRSEVLLAAAEQPPLPW